MSARQTRVMGTSPDVAATGNAMRQLCLLCLHRLSSVQNAALTARDMSVCSSNWIMKQGIVLFTMNCWCVFHLFFPWSLIISTAHELSKISLHHDYITRDQLINPNREIRTRRVSPRRASFFSARPNHSEGLREKYHLSPLSPYYPIPYFHHISISQSRFQKQRLR